VKAVDRNAKATDRTTKAVDRNAKATDRTVKAEDNMLYRSMIALD